MANGSEPRLAGGPMTATDVQLGPYDALLFDMDGTILTSIAATERAWSAWAHRVGAPVDAVLASMHGRRAVDVVGQFLPAHADVAAEVAWLDARELEDLEGIAEVPGAGAFLSALPRNRWAVVTSANRDLAAARIGAAGLPWPDLLISSDDVRAGKPDPEGYRRAAAALGVAAGRCVVFEDAVAGIRAGLAAGAEIVRVGAGTGVVPVSVAIAGYEGVRTRPVGDAVLLAIPERARL